MNVKKKTDGFSLRNSGSTTQGKTSFAFNNLLKDQLGCGVNITQEEASFDCRNLMKNQLGGVIFGCYDNTINECLLKQIFGMPYNHMAYVKNIDPGLPLFLFNYSNRRLHGIFEAASPGALNINPYGWTNNALKKTEFPAQVQIHVRQQYQPVPEDRFKHIIADNYHSPKKFWFELDHAQALKLISLMSSSVAPSTSVVSSTSQCKILFHASSLFKGRLRSGSSASQFGSLDDSLCSNEDNQLVEASSSGQAVGNNEKDIIYMKLKELALNSEHPDISSASHVDDDADIISNNRHIQDNSHFEAQAVSKLNQESVSHNDFLVPQLIDRIEAFEQYQIQRMDKFKEEMGDLEKKWIHAQTEIERLKERSLILESLSSPTVASEDVEIVTSTDATNLHTNEVIFLVGGFNGRSWLPALTAYSPSQNVFKSLRPMNIVRPYSSLAKLNGELYVFGGSNGNSCYDSAESYNPANNRWTLRPSLNKKKSSLAGASLNEKIYAIGGAIGLEIFADVEMFDLDVGRWIPTRSMLQKRTALAAAELNGVLYAVGGFNGNFLKSAERFDPREHSWTKIESMNSSRGFHSLVVFHEKLYAFGGYDGNAMTETVEIYEPRLGKWEWGVQMGQPRGYPAVSSFKDFIYVFGGMKNGVCFDTVERLKDDVWEVVGEKGSTRRCCFSAMVL